MYLDGEVYVCNLKTNLAYKEIRSYLSNSAVLKEHLAMNKMVVNNNGSSNVNSYKESTSNQMNQKQVKILSQSIIKAANLTSRKEFLNKVLQNSDSKIRLLKKARTETKHQGDRTLPGREDTEWLTQKPEHANTDDGSLAERQITNVHINKSDISKNISDSKESHKSNKQERRNKMKQKKLEVISESSDSENDRENVHCDRKLKKQHRSSVDENRVKEKIISESSSSDSENDSMKNDKKAKDYVDKKGSNVHRKSELSSMDSESDSSCSRSSTHKSNSSRSDSETDDPKHDKNKRIMKDNGSLKHNKNTKNSARNKGKNINKDSKLSSVDSRTNSSSSGESNRKSHSSSSDSENDVSKNNNKKKRNFDKSKDPKSESSNSNSDSSQENKRTKISADRRKQTASDSSDTSVSKVENKRKRKLSKTKSNVDESINKRRKYSPDSNRILSEPEKLLKAFAENSGYSKVLKKCEDMSDLLSDSEDVYLVQIPKYIDPHLLINKTISFDRPTKLKIDNESYVWDVNHEHKDVCIMNSNKLHNVSTKGSITLRQHLKSKSKCMQLKPLNNIPDMPNNLKVRHPLFGPDYEDKVELEADILAKLEEITAAVDKRHKKKKSKKKHKKELEAEQPENLDIIKLLNERESQMHEDNVESKDAAVKKNKKHKKKAKSHEVDNEMQTIISEMFPDIEKPKKKKRHSLEIHINPKDDRHKQNNSLPDTSKIEQKQLKMSTTDYKSTKRKNKASRHILQTQEKDDNNTKEESTLITSSEEIQHKRNHDKVLNSTMLSPVASNILQLDESYIPKAKKKHKHRKSIDIFVDDLVKDVDMSIDARETKKKKRKHKHSDRTD